MISPMKIEEWLQRMVMQDSQHAFILLDADARIVAWLGAAEQIFGFTFNEVANQKFHILFAPEDLDKEMPQWEVKVAASDGHAENDRWMLRKDGRRFWATGVLMPLRAGDGSISGFAKILRNRTDIKGQLESVRNLCERLQKTIERKNNFIATLAHELRNPLAAISNSLAMLSLTSGQDDDSKYCRATIQRQLDHMQRMVTDLLEVAKADIGKIKLELRNLVINDLLRSAVESCRPAIDRQSHRLELLMQDEPIIVNADAARLQQVFVNLLENAAKYTNRGGMIWVKLLVEGSEAVVRFEDTGIGIAPEIMPQIFDMFTQAETSQDSGIGIGLSLVKDLTQLHGGTVQVRSDGIGKGSEFTVRLPLAGSDAARPDRPEAV
jgi:PAS domain S-box-containing protein